MQQYEERLKRVNEYMEQSNQSYQKCQEELTHLKTKTQKLNQERDNALSLIIETSIDIKSVIQNIDEKASTYMQRMTGFQIGPGKQNTTIQDGI